MYRYNTVFDRPAAFGETVKLCPAPAFSRLAIEEQLKAPAGLVVVANNRQR